MVCIEVPISAPLVFSVVVTVTQLLFIFFVCAAHLQMECGSRKRSRDKSAIGIGNRKNKRPTVLELLEVQTENSRLLKELTASRWKNRKLILDHRKERAAATASLAEERAAAAASLAEERAAAMASLADERASLADERAGVAAIIEPLEPFGGLKKMTDRTALVAAVGSVVVSLMSVALFQNCVFGVEATKAMLSDLYKKFYFQEQRNVFAPWKVLRAIDLSSVGGLNYNGLETLRNVEELERYQCGILPSRSTVQKVLYELHDIGQRVIPFERKQCSIGEMYQYDYERFLQFILKIFQLEEIAQRESVELSITLDGAELCDGIYHLTAGIKVTDARAIDPRDGSPLSMTMDEVMGHMFQNQSRNNCFALKCLIGKDCKRR
jgi:hypothetical protein